MPITPATVQGIMLPNLLGVTLVGVGTPKLARALGIALSTWTPKIGVSTIDAGTLGSGKGVPIPVVIPPPVLQGNLTAGFVAQGILGLMAPVVITGLTNGFVQSYATALTNTTHVGVGLGSGVARFNPPPAFADLKAGFSAVGSNGSGGDKLCRALAQALESTFKILVLPQPIVGPPSISPGTGKGFGTIF